MIGTCLLCDRRQRPCSGPCLCLESNVDIQIAATRPCPLGKHAGTPGPVMAPDDFNPAEPASVLALQSAEAKRRWHERGPALWSEVHTHPIPENLEAALAWWLALRARFPPGCDCVAHLAAYIGSTPPDLSSPDAYRRWGWALHNAVNVRLGKPELSCPEAAALWDWPA